MYEAYSIVSLVLFVFMAIVWSSEEFLNIFIKMIFIFMCLWAALDSADRLGYVDTYGRKAEQTQTTKE